MTSQTQKSISNDELLDMFAELFQEPRNSIMPDRKLESIEGWDSVGILTLMAEIDEKFGVALSTEDIQNFVSLSDIIAWLTANNVEIS